MSECFDGMVPAHLMYGAGQQEPKPEEIVHPGEKSGVYDIAFGAMQYIGLGVKERLVEAALKDAEDKDHFGEERPLDLVVVREVKHAGYVSPGISLHGIVPSWRREPRPSNVEGRKDKNRNPGQGWLFAVLGVTVGGSSPVFDINPELLT